jgi:hypothetical protein
VSRCVNASSAKAVRAGLSAISTASLDTPALQDLESPGPAPYSE